MFLRTENLSVKKAFLFSLISYGAIVIIMVLLTPLVSRVYPLGEDQGASWYFWKLPQPQAAVRFSFWTGYLLHQLSIIFLLLAGRKERPEPGQTGKYNLMVMGVNLLFIVLHQVQTLIWYDGLAQDVPVFSSQGSVIVMLVLLLYLMIPRRGLFFGKIFTPPQKMYRFIRKWHGLYISWALIYTFWFHPMEGNWGMTSGFIYMFLLFTQLNLFNTTQHTKIYWIVLLEVFVAVHATLITLYKESLNMMESSSDHIWAMFFFGFMVMFILTQMYSFKWKKNTNLIVSGFFLLSIGFVYGFFRGVTHIYEILFIPVALYGGAGLLLLAGYIWERR